LARMRGIRKDDRAQAFASNQVSPFVPRAYT
jgi:hypothetical protein